MSANNVFKEKIKENEQIGSFICVRFHIFHLLTDLKYNNLKFKELIIKISALTSLTRYIDQQKIL